MKTWDNQDVIIPNSDLTSTAFINWTRSNNDIHTVLIIGIRYQDDPHKAKTVIEEAGIGIPFPQQDIYIKELPTTDSPLFTDIKHK